MDTGGEGDKRDVRRPMNAFLIFCKRHRSIVREKNPDLDNRSVTRILGDLWANLKEDEKVVYTDLAKQYKDAFMKANPDYKWHNPEKTLGCQKTALALSKPTNAKVMRTDMNLLTEGSITPGKLADPNNMGGLSLLLMAGEQSGPVPVPVPTRSLSMLTATESSSTLSSTTLQSVSSPLATLSSTNLSSAFLSSMTQPFSSLSSAAFPSSVSSISGTEPNNFNTGTLSQGQGQALNMVEENKKENNQVVADGGLRHQDYKSAVKVEETAMSGMQLKNPGVEKSWENYLPGKNGCLDVLVKAVGDADSRPMKSWETFQSKPLLYQAVAAPKIPQRSLLAEAFKGGYSEILRDNSTSTKMANFENQGKLFEDEMNKEIMEQKLANETDGKENLTQTLTNQIKSGEEIKDDQKSDNDVVEEESAMVTCGKLVVNHIIDKLYSSELGTGARKLNGKSDEIDGERKTDDNGDCEKKTEIKTEADEEKSKNVLENCFDEAKFCAKGSMEATGGAAKNFNTGFNGDDAKTRLEYTNLKTCEKLSDETVKDIKHETVTESSTGQSQAVSATDLVEYESEETDEFQPVRKSRRRNRGQRYQELINEGIIQRSKERAAALQQTTPKEESTEEDIQPLEPLNSYILPETAIRRIRKRTTSESAKDKMLHPDDVKRYKTGDFDLEAQIATLPACSIENMGRKRGFPRQRHSSECIHTRRKITDCETSLHPTPAFDLQKAVSLPPHIKIPSPENNKEPVIGSRKRKARKHSITHMIPAPPTLVKNGIVKTDTDSLGPCVIKPSVLVSKDETDYLGKDKSVHFVKTDYRDQNLGAPVNSRSRSNSDISEKFSDWSKCEMIRNRMLQNKNERSLSVSDVVNDKTNTEHSVSVKENKSETGSDLCASRDVCLSQKTVTQSGESFKNNSVGAEMVKSVPDAGQQDKLKCEISTSDTENTNTKTEKFIGKDCMEEVQSGNTKSKQSGHLHDGSSLSIKEETPVQKQIGVDNITEVVKDVNSNTTMNS